MMISFAHDRQVVEFVKNNDRFVLVYPNTPVGRVAAKEAVRDWLLNCDLDFNRHDAEMLWRAVDAIRFHATYGPLSQRDVEWRRKTI
jgi:hypothetical protein